MDELLTMSKTELNRPSVVPETSNTKEQVIGWTIKERYRTMRGYKRGESILHVGMLTAWLREAPGGRDMSALFAS